jgi:uncharacterized protein
MTNPNSPINPFIVGPPIKDARFFVGRKEELNEIINCIDGVQPTSINIVGERRIGKTSLLYHLDQTWAERVKDPNRFILIYVSMQKSGVCKKRGFFTAIAQELLKKPQVADCPDLAEALNKSEMDTAAFTDAMTIFGREKRVPILCLDEFHLLFESPKEFDNAFYNGLRSIMDESRMVIIAATLHRIQDYKLKHSLTSTFFNQARTLHLKGLKPDEINDLLCLPACNNTVLNPREQKLARDWSVTNHPYFLQMAADALCQARLNNKDEAWAKKHFDEEIRSIVPSVFKRPGLITRCLHTVFWKFPVRIGALVKKTGLAIDTLASGIMGWFVIVFILLVIFGFVKPDEFMAGIKWAIRSLREIGTK